MTGRRASFATALLVAALALTAAWLFTWRVPPDRIGVTAAPSGGGAILEDGWHLLPPWTAAALLPRAPRPYQGKLSLPTPEGATLEIPFRATLDFSRAEPAALGPLVIALSDGEPIDAAVTRLVGAAAAPAGSAPPGETGSLESRLMPIGLVPGTLELGPSRTAASTTRNPLAASWVPPPWPILVIGIDAADWDLIAPLIESGALPNLRALRDRGAWGTLRSMKPTLSPILWTTIATGRPPEDHGVLDFLMKDPATGTEVPISRVFRRVKALWNIATDFGLPSRTIGWWATWPAESVSGEMVTDRVAYSLFDLPAAESPAGAVHPESLSAEVAALKVADDAVPWEEYRGIVDVPLADFERARQTLDSPEAYTDPLAHLIKVMASTLTYQRIALRLLERRREGLTLVYFEGLDEVNHRFAHLMPPPMSLAAPVDPALRAAGRDAIPNFYRFQDRLVGELVRAAGPDAVVMVLSDHGFANGRERPVDVPPDIEGQPGLWHTLDGVLILAGPPVRPGRLERPAELLDVAPTLLALMGLPKAGDMPGRVLDEALLPGAAPRPPEQALASYDGIGEPVQAAGAATSPGDREMIARLTALGYIQSGGGEAPSSGTPTWHINAGHVFLARRELDRAEQEFARARQLAPNYDQPLLGLAQVSMARGKPAEAIPLLVEVLQKTPEPQPSLLTRVAQVYIRAGRQPDGIDLMKTLSYDGRREAYRLTAVGMLREKGDPEGAVRNYQEALAIDPSVERALRGVYFLMKRQGALEELAVILRRSTAVEPPGVAVRASNWLALVREAQGHRPEARDILSAALGRAPDDLMTLTNLGSMYVRDDLARDGLPYLERAHQRHPASFEVIVNLIVAHGKLGNLDAAREHFRKGEQIARRPELYNAISQACFLNGAVADASTYITRSLELDPSQDDARRFKAQIDQRKGS